MAGLGPTIAPLAEELGRAGVTPIAKMEFSACDNHDFERAFAASGARAAGIELCRTSGAVVTTMESVVFDWLRRAGGETFKHLSKRIR